MYSQIISNVKINRINYLVFARNEIVAKGQVKGSNSKSLKFNFQPSFSMSPSAKIIAFYVTSDGEIISDYKFLNFDNLLPNFVSIDSYPRLFSSFNCFLLNNFHFLGQN